MAFPPFATYLMVTAFGVIGKLLSGYVYMLWYDEDFTRFVCETILKETYRVSSIS